ncbi:MAG: ATPase [Oscillospiraceae bacterium]|nr:ATPase [Oscillospiraceae bacterium]MDE5852824.1 ATPase [Oscillospiraceae bacterium]
MTINEILDTLDNLIACAWNIPMTGGKCAVSTTEVQDLINDIRLALPTEIKQSKMIIADKNDIISNAKKEAKKIISDAEKQAKRLLLEDSVVKQAQKKANQMIAKAHSQSNELRKTTNEYVENLLTNAEDSLLKSIQDLKSAHLEIKRISKTK